MPPSRPLLALALAPITVLATTAQAGPLTPAEARAVVASFQARRLQQPSGALANPRSLEDVEAILKRDQVGLFEAAVDLASRTPGTRALALRGQLELAWAEAEQILARLMRGLEQRLRATAPARPPAERAEQLRLADDLARTAAAFEVLAAEHLTAGSASAQKLIAAEPDSYLGYRVAADYFRLIKDWPAFARVLAALERSNPRSNGLNFLRGMAAAYRDSDRAAAARWLYSALAIDRHFVRAQAHLMMLQTELADIYREYQALEKLNPEHQIIEWAGRSIEQAYQAAQPR